MQTHSFSDSFWDLLKGWYLCAKAIDPEDDEAMEEVYDKYEAYAAGVRDGKIELATEIFEHLDLINLN